MSTNVTHPYHLVNPSKWPVLTAFSILAFVVGGALALHHEPAGLPVVFLGASAILACCFFWWRDVIREGLNDHAHTAKVRRGLRAGMALFICSEVMFFVAFFWAYFGAAFFPKLPLEDVWAIAPGIWPPANIIAFDAFDLPLINTLILLLSGTTVTWAHHALLSGNRRDLIRGLAATVALGLCFTLFQAYEYSHAAFGLKDGKYAATFFLATGFHGLHVMIGTAFLAVMLVRARRGTLSTQGHLGFEFAAWYWHFVDVVWLFLFVGIYWLTSN
ncbi:MAG: cytochrome c oxidase subunit 3 [Alphaproteobacteria bacterium]|nr:cytochrome c oxidase subunit 3 [Alphaproteobacteria bacterium]